MVSNVSLATKVKRQVSYFMEEAGLPMPEGGVQVQKVTKKGSLSQVCGGRHIRCGASAGFVRGCGTTK